MMTSSPPLPKLPTGHGTAILDQTREIELQELLSETESHPSDDGGSQTSLNVPTRSDGIAAGVRRRLYVSHFLSTWNSRMFEFGAVLFIAKIFPGTLLPVSIYAVIRAASAIVLSPAVGKYIDTKDRLKVVRLSIGKYELEVSFHGYYAANHWARFSGPAALYSLLMCGLRDTLSISLRLDDA